MNVFWSFWWGRMYWRPLLTVLLVKLCLVNVWNFNQFGSFWFWVYLAVCPWDAFPGMFRGFGSPDKRVVVKNLIFQYNIDVVCLQESKLSHPSSSCLLALGSLRLKQWKVLSTSGSAGGILVGWNDNMFHKISSWVDVFSVSVVLENGRDGFQWMLTSVYGPSNYPVNLALWSELQAVRQFFSGLWVLCGDFHATRFSSKRINGQSSRKDMELFGNLVRGLNLVDLPLGSQNFTWSKRGI